MFLIKFLSKNFLARFYIIYKLVQLYSTMITYFYVNNKFYIGVSMNDKVL